MGNGVFYLWLCNETVHFTGVVVTQGGYAMGDMHFICV
eukprot:gene26731-biopygen17247